MAQSVGAVALDIVMGKNTVSGVAKQAIQEVQKTFNDGTSSIGKKVSAVGIACKNVGASLLPVSAAATGVIKSTADAAMSFETAMAQVETIAGESAVSYKGKMTDMSKAIMQLSTDTGIAAEDVAAATYNAISAGVDVSKSVEFVATANALAVGGFTDMTTSVDVLTTTLNAYGDKAGTAESISDKLITTQNLGKTTVNELASSMGKVIPTASAYGISIDNLCASYVAMTKGGIATAESTTYMKSMFNELADSGSTVGTILQEQTGKSFGQLMNEGKSLADVIEILGQSVNGDSEAFAQLWGSSEAGTGALAILNGGTADFNNTLKEMGNSTGAASSAMDKMNDTSAHKMQVAMNDMKNAAIELGGAFAPVMSGIASAVSAVARAFSNLPAPVNSAIAVVLGVVAVAAPVLMAIGSITSGIGSLVSVVGVISGAISSFIGFISASVIPALGSFFAFLAANPIVLIIGAIIAVGALLITHWEEVKQVAVAVWEGIKNTISRVWEGIKAVFNTVINFVKENWQGLLLLLVNPFAGAFKLLYDNCEGFRNFINNFLQNVKNAVSNAFNAVKTAISNAVSAAKNAVSNGFNAIRNTISNIANGIKNTVSSAFKSMLSAIKNTVGNIASAIKNGFNSAFSFMKSIPSQALQWGKDMIMGIVNGIKSCIGKVGDAVKSVADKIRSFLHFSVPDEGPLTDYESWMPDFIQGMANGVEKNKYRLVNAVKGMAGEMAIPAMSAPALKNVGSSGGNAVAGSVSADGNEKLYGLLTQLINNMQNMTFTVPVYLGNDIIDERIVSAEDRRTVRSGGRA